MKRGVLSLVCICVFLSYTGCVGRDTGVSVGFADPERTVIDGSGAVLKIPESSDGITIASVYAAAVPFIAALELSGQVLAVNVKSRFWTDTDESLAAAGTAGRGTVDLEALAGFAPDVLIHRSNDAATVEAVQGKLGIPVLCINAESFDDVAATLVMMGRYFGREQRAAQVLEWLNGKFMLIDEIAAGIPDEERVTALVMGGTLGRVAGGDMLQSWMIQKAGGICAASGIASNRNWIDAGVEAVFRWNPDIIFCTSSTVLDYSPESLIEDPAWSAVSAVKDGRVYTIPAKIDSWDLPGISCALGTMYMLNRMYPGYFTDEQLRQEIDEYYIFMFGKTFDRSYLGYSLFAQE
ncbi:MAG: ABC transporter substrate-binding protein [Oscillospiraceae bacterium]|nr:ABC transporter substrate-binding protein [Oscillospiraceae bacterium]